MYPTWAPRVVTLMAALIVFAVTAHLLTHRPLLTWADNTNAITATDVLDIVRREFWTGYYKDVVETRPNCSRIQQDIKVDAVSRDDQPPLRQEHETLNIDHEQKESLQSTHAAFLDRLQYRTYDLPYVPHSRGIVIAADGDYIMNALVSVHMIRKTGCTLPVELFVSEPSESDPRLCEEIFPTLNAKCVFVHELIGEKAAAALVKYEYKLLAMLFSSFEEFLSLDADNFPLYNPESLFVSPPFTTHGLVIWPDYWHTSESRHLFDVAQYPIEDIGALSSSESSQIMFNKRTHADALMMATYYNLHGPGYYYKLLSQGAAGEGDKETFAWGARLTHSPFYHVKAGPIYLGYTGHNGAVRGSNMGQSDPRIDFAVSVNKDESQQKRPFFIHAQNPKLNPKRLFVSRSNIKEDTFNYDTDGTPHRLYGETVEHFKNNVKSDVDTEQIMWETMSDLVCDYSRLFSTRMCKVGRQFVADLFYNGTLEWQ